MAAWVDYILKYLIFLPSHLLALLSHQWRGMKMLRKMAKVLCFWSMVDGYRWLFRE